MDKKHYVILVVIVVLVAIGAGVIIGFFSASASDKSCVCPTPVIDTFNEPPVTNPMSGFIGSGALEQTFITPELKAKYPDMSGLWFINLYPAVYFKDTPYIWFHPLDYEIYLKLIQFDKHQPMIYDYGTKRWIRLDTQYGIKDDVYEGRNFHKIMINLKDFNQSKTNVADTNTVSNIDPRDLTNLNMDTLLLNRNHFAVAHTMSPVYITTHYVRGMARPTVTQPQRLPIKPPQKIVRPSPLNLDMNAIMKARINIFQQKLNTRW